MATGTIARFVHDKGFGFIKTEDSDDDVFFHHSAFQGDEPREGQTVEFEIEESDRGPRAKNVTPA
ncbi:MAG: cold shock domain-containing protein [Euryarchaeota archaeon]|nr:cold shock domain-containing protein [Euryarchaeota archaeon]